MKSKLLILLLAVLLSGCEKNSDYNGRTINDYLKKTRNDEYITAQYSYNQDNLIDEVNSTSFYRKFHYNSKGKLIKEEVAISPDSYSSMMPAGGFSHEFVDPEKTGISMYSVFEYDTDGRLIKQLNYVPSVRQDELRSIMTFEYDQNNRISKVLLHDGKEVLTQYQTYIYDSNGNVIEHNSYSYLFIPAGTSPTHLSRAEFEYDSYNNPYAVFYQSGWPGINTNPNNIIKIRTYNLLNTPGIDDINETTIEYQYNHITRYPERVINGEEFIYDR
ncbi:MAG: hypothetical protein IPJ16_05050 [Bacteroidales bacterium]|nr:hypothetical protein [Bacteroidales bacterium]